MIIKVPDLTDEVRFIDFAEARGGASSLSHGPFRVQTVEHLLAALVGAGVTDARIEVQPPKRSHNPSGEVFEASADMKMGFGIRNGPCESNRLFEEDGGLAAGQPNHRWKTGLLSKYDGTSKTWLSDIEAGKEQHVLGYVET